MSDAKNSTCGESLTQRYPALTVEKKLDASAVERLLPRIKVEYFLTTDERLEAARFVLSNPGPRKFVLYTDGVDMYMIIGARDFLLDGHEELAWRNGIRNESVLFGGIADLENHRIWGKSYRFGTYDTEAIRQILPDWQIDPSSDY